MTAVRVAVDDKHYTHNQGVPATDVVVTHNLGKYPAVSITDTSLREIDCDVQHLNMNQTRITMVYATSWVAVFN